MTPEVYFFAGIAVAILFALFWLLRQPGSKSVQNELRGKVAIEELLNINLIKLNNIIK